MGADELPGGAEVHRGSDAVEPGAPLDLVLVHDRTGVAVAQPVLISKPVRALSAPKERGSGFQPAEPLSEVTAGDDRDAGDQVLVHLRRVGQGQVAPPGWGCAPSVK